jgi:hypothetical protein
MKRTLALALALLLTLAFALPAMAQENFRVILNFDLLPELNLGSLEDRGADGSGADNFVRSGLALTGHIVITAEDDIGVSGKGLKIHMAAENLPETGQWVETVMRVNQHPRANSNVEGAEYFWFWIDMSNWGSIHFPLIVVMEEIDDGVMVAWDIVSENTPVYFEDGEGGWTEIMTGLGEDGEPEPGRIRAPIPENYKGWVKMPTSGFRDLGWGGAPRADGSIQWMNVVEIYLCMTALPSNEGGWIVFDSIGVSGADVRGSTPLPYPPGEGGENGTGEDPDPTPADPSPGETTPEEPPETSPEVSPSAEPSPSSPPADDSGGLDTWLIIAIIAGGLVIIGAVVILLVKKKK